MNTFTRAWRARLVAVGVMALLAGVVGFVMRPAEAAPPPAGTTPALTKFTESLPVPPVIDARSGGGVTLEELPGTHQFHAQLPATPSWGYSPPRAGNTYLGPTLEVQKGTPVDVTVTNQLGAHPLAYAIDNMLMGADASQATQPQTAVHLHGGHTTVDNDGGPPGRFGPGQSKTYHYGNDQEATTLWYHDHSLGMDRLNVVNGLAGFYLVRDAADTGRPGNPLGLPTGAKEIPLVIQDRMFNPDGTVNYGVRAPLAPFQSTTQLGTNWGITTWIPEWFGDTATVNGKAYPNLNVDPALYRFRLLNGSNARFYKLTLGGKTRMWQIGSEGGLFNAPVPLKELLIAPGERADLLIDFSESKAGDTMVLTNNAPAPFPTGPRAVRRGGVPLPEIMQFTVNATPPVAPAIPASLRGQAPLSPTIPATAAPAGVKVRNVFLNEIIDPVSLTPVRVLLNNVFLDDPLGRIEQPTADTVEQWNIINTTADTHPIHLHLTQFRVLGRQKFNVNSYMGTLNAGLPPGVTPLPDPSAAGLGPWPAPSADPFTQGGAMAANANEVGWKDTVQSNPGEILRILVPFGGTASGLTAPFTTTFTTPAGGDSYVWHCHILEHEENDMMQFYTVT